LASWSLYGSINIFFNVNLVYSYSIVRESYSESHLSRNYYMRDLLTKTIKTPCDMVGKK
jgi:hypothetical protein